MRQVDSRPYRSLITAVLLHHNRLSDLSAVSGVRPETLRLIAAGRQPRITLGVATRLHRLCALLPTERSDR